MPNMLCRKPANDLKKMGTIAKISKLEKWEKRHWRSPGKGGAEDVK